MLNGKNSWLAALAASAMILASCGGVKPPAPVAPKSGGAPDGTFSHRRVNTGEAVVALTFDDGPSAANPPRLLEILRDKGVKATFFMIGKNVAAHPEVVRQVAGGGHEIGSHSWSHPRFPNLGDDAVRRELRQTEEALLAAAGVKPRYLRPPYGSLTAAQREWIHREFGYEFIYWDVDPNDWRKPGVDEVTARIVNSARPGSILLLHDIHADSVAAVPAIIDQLRAKGFKFLTVSELLGRE
jgi:peptidoglycan/xylan/chitin deacetylase (PgdA/CDA1 family)